MNMQELATAKMYGIGAIHVALINNGWLGMVRQWQELFHDERYSETTFRCRPARLREARRELRLRRFRCETPERGGRRHHGGAGSAARRR